MADNVMDELQAGERIRTLDQLYDMLVEVISGKVEVEGRLLEQLSVIEFEITNGMKVISRAINDLKELHMSDVRDIRAELSQLKSGLFDNWKLTAENRVLINELMRESGDNE